MTFWEVAHNLQNQNENFFVATVLTCRGSSPQDPGAKVIVTKDGLQFGTVGGGKVEAKVIELGKSITMQNETHEPRVVTWNLQKDIGMSCGGEMTFLFETYSFKQWQILLFGAGHVSQALVQILVNLQCQLTVIDNRQEWLDKLPTSSNLKKICSLDPAGELSKFNSQYYYLTMTQGHSVDLPILKQLFTLFPDAPFIGTIGSDVKGKKLRRELSEFGISNEYLSRFHCPIGLNLGGNQPFEIAISVSAQLLQERDRQSSLLKDSGLKIVQPTLSEML